MFFLCFFFYGFSLFTSGQTKTFPFINEAFRRILINSLQIVINVILSGLKPIRITYYDKCVDNRNNRHCDKAQEVPIQASTKDGSESQPLKEAWQPSKKL